MVCNNAEQTLYSRLGVIFLFDQLEILQHVLWQLYSVVSGAFQSIFSAVIVSEYTAQQLSSAGKCLLKIKANSFYISLRRTDSDFFSGILFFNISFVIFFYHLIFFIQLHNCFITVLLLMLFFCFFFARLLMFFQRFLCFDFFLGVQ